MKNTLHSMLFHFHSFSTKLNKKKPILFLCAIFLFSINLAHAQLPVTYDFEVNDFQGWTSNGNRSGIYNSSGWSCGGTYSIYSRRNQTNKNIMTSPQIDLTSYNDVTISFCHKSLNLENGEGFRLQFFNGSNWTTIKTFVRGTDFTNQGTGNAHSLTSTITDATYTFSNNSRFRFSGTSNDDNEWNFFDDITITGTNTSTPPVNDNCANATLLTPGTSCNPVVGTTVNATQSLPGCTGTANDDVWYSFVATSTEHTITVDALTINDIVFEVFTNGCGVTSLVCTDSNGGSGTESSTLTGLNIGDTYYVRVYSYFSNSVNSGTFDICVIELPPAIPTPPNDDCSNAISLTPSSVCNPVTGTTVGGTQSLPGCTGWADDDVWYSFVATSTDHTITVEAGTIYNIVFEVFVASCNGTSILCKNNTGASSAETATLTALNVGTTYYVRVYSLNNGASFNGTFDICVIELPPANPTPPNDDCSNAISLTPSFVCNPVTGTTVGGTQSLPGCSGTADDDVWYSFVATRPELVITVEAGTIYNIVFEVFVASCNGTSILCKNNTGGYLSETQTLTALNVGTTYYVRVYSLNNGASYSGTFDICILETCQSTTGIGTSSLACPSVDAGGLGSSGSDVSINCSVGTTSLEANYLHLGETTSYNVEPITYSPPFQFGCLEYPVSVNVDDVFSPEVTLPFDFCFYGNTYDSVVIGSNGVISFDTSLANQQSGWNTNNNIPTDVNASEYGPWWNPYQIDHDFGASIHGVHHDVDPSVGGEIGYQLITLDTGCRALVASWNEVPMFDDNSLFYTGMIVLYEDTNIVEVYIKEKEVHSTWNSGNASIGLQGDSTTATVAPNRNTTDPNWSATNEAWRFTPSGTSITTLKWYENSISAANEIIDPNNDGEIEVSPLETTTYYAEVTYDLCSGATLVELDPTVVTVEGKKTWNGSQSTAWENPNNWTPVGVPVDTNCITIPNTTNDPVMLSTTNGYGYNLAILDDATLTQQSKSSLTIEDVISIEPNGEFDLNDSASIIQITDVNINKNTGTSKVKRTVSAIDNSHYVYWSTPVDIFDIEDISPGSSRFYKWQPTQANGTSGQHGNWISTLENMVHGKGYIVKGIIGTSAPNTAEFKGIINNGKISTPISRGTYTSADYTGLGNTATAEDDNWNLLGNPYPSAISLNEFVTANPAIDGTLYFWRHLTPATSGLESPFHQEYYYNYSVSDYLAANSLGSAPPGFNDYIASGQGFFTLMLDSAPTSSNVTFSNTMRKNTYDNDRFYRDTSTNEKHRIWLDLVNSDNIAFSTLIGYATGATNDIDRLYDGVLMVQSRDQFYSLVSDQKLTIQGKALPFDDSETIPLGVKSASSGSYTITINKLDGLFADTEQDIYLEDTELNIIHDLRTSPYAFTVDQGITNDRFVLRFTNQALSIKDQDIVSNVDIRSINNTINVTSKQNHIKTFELMDVTGRMIHKNLNVKDANYSFQTSNINSGTYIVTVTLENGAVVSEKVII